MNNEIEGYIAYKGAQFIIFSSYNIKKMGAFYDVETLDILEKVLTSLTEKGYIISTVKDSILRLLSEARDVNDMDKEKRIEIINSIITLLNNEVEDKYLDFYRIELIKRKKSIKYLFSSIEEINKFVNHIHNSIVYDAIVLSSLDEEVSDEKFIKENLPELSKCPYYVESINAILSECPTIFNNLTFYNRNMLVLNSLDEDIYADNKKKIKKIVRKVKKIK